MTLLLNTSSGVNSNSSTGNSLAATISPTVADTIVLAISYSFTSSADEGNFNGITSISDNIGLAWNLRSSKQFTGVDAGTTYFLQIDVWWALKPTSGSVIVTGNYGHTVHTTIGSSLALLAISGVQNFTNPFDTNASLPALKSNFGSSAAISSGSASTSSQPTFVFSMAADVFGSANTGTGMSNGERLQPGYAADTEFLITTSTGAQTINWSGTSAAWAVVTDAITGAAAPDSATITTTLKKIAQSASGTVSDNYGTIATHLTKMSQSVSATFSIPPRSGTITTNLKKVSQTLSTQEEFVGTISTSLGKISQSLTQELVTGEIVQNLRLVGQNVQAKEEFVGTIVTNIDSQAAFQVVARTFEEFVGTIHMTLSPMKFSQSLSGYEEMVGTITTRLGNANGQLAATVVEALEIIEGPIVMNLQGFRPLILGAKLGTPGAGPWYSWRQTAS